MLAILLSLGGCVPKTENRTFEAQVSDLNGTWNENFNNRTEAEINKIRDKLNRDPKRKKEFGWGVGYSYPNGWAFDIGEGRNDFYTSIAGLYQVLSAKKSGRTTLEVRVIMDSTYEELLAEGADEKRIEEFVTLLVIEFKNADRMIIKDPRKNLFLPTGPVEFYRLSGPNMPFIEN
jgi:hypothetical protein